MPLLPVKGSANRAIHRVSISLSLLYTKKFLASFILKTRFQKVCNIFRNKNILFFKRQSRLSPATKIVTTWWTRVKICTYINSKDNLPPYLHHKRWTCEEAWDPGVHNRHRQKSTFWSFHFHASVNLQNQEPPNNINVKTCSYLLIFKWLWLLLLYTSWCLFASP